MKRVVKNGVRGPRQTHMNKTKFDPNKYKHAKEQLTERVTSVMTTLCCRRCCEIIQWKADYGKYIPLEAARKCNLCGKRSVLLAYHRICRSCATEQARCAKCQKPAAMLLLATQPDDGEDSDPDTDAESMVSDAQNARFAFLAEEPRFEELSPLRGLDVRPLEEEIEDRQREEQQEVLRRLPERKRRAVLRAQEGKATEDSDDDEVL